MVRCGLSRLEGGHLLDKSITSAASAFILLQLNKIKLAKGLKDVLEVGFVDAEMDVADIQPMKRNRVMVSSNVPIGVPGLSVLLSLSQLSYNGDS